MSHDHSIKVYNKNVLEPTKSSFFFLEKLISFKCPDPIIVEQEVLKRHHVNDMVLLLRVVSRMFVSFIDRNRYLKSYLSHPSNG